MKQSQLFTKTRKVITSDEPSINAQLLERAGFISKLMAGVYSYLPLGFRVLSKIEVIVKEEMDAIGGQEVFLPALHPKEVWEVTGRWDVIDVLYKLKGAGDRDLGLGPTHEEIITPLVAHYIQSYKDLPFAAYQIQTKFRNEARSKSGLLRGREFRMKDLYSFHASQEDLDRYYELVKAAYIRIFTRCGLGDITYFTYASGGVFSKYSHEFQTVTEYGEDRVHVCVSCHIAINKEIIQEISACPECGNKNLEEKKAIEVGNIFKLGTRFSEPCNANFTDQEGKQHPAIMGCYGLGTSRLMGSIVEILHDKSGIVWPKEVAPYAVHLIALGKSDEVYAYAQNVYDQLIKRGIDVLFDDRREVNAGEKFADSDLIGIPTRVVVSQKTMAENNVELKDRKTGIVSSAPLDSLLLL
jgi:prolyl-tRNA synthetase